MRCATYAPQAQAAPTGTAEALVFRDGTASWYVAYTQARQEDIALLNLKQQNFLTYLPLYKTRDGGGRCEPMFPRYVFFRPLNSQQSIAAVRSTRGVQSIVQFGSRFALLKPEVLAAIHEQEIRRQLSDRVADPPYKPGQRVRLNDPVLNVLDGLVHSVSTQRIMLLMEILGRPLTVKVDPARLQRA